jgi:hypothetical protein
MSGRRHDDVAAHAGFEGRKAHMFARFDDVQPEAARAREVLGDGVGRQAARDGAGRPVAVRCELFGDVDVVTSAKPHGEARKGGRVGHDGGAGARRFARTRRSGRGRRRSREIGKGARRSGEPAGPRAGDGLHEAVGGGLQRPEQPNGQTQRRGEALPRFVRQRMSHGGTGVDEARQITRRVVHLRPGLGQHDVEFARELLVARAVAPAARESGQKRRVAQPRLLKRHGGDEGQRLDPLDDPRPVPVRRFVDEIGQRMIRLQPAGQRRGPAPSAPTGRRSPPDAPSRRTACPGR